MMHANAPSRWQRVSFLALAAVTLAVSVRITNTRPAEPEEEPRNTSQTFAPAPDGEPPAVETAFQNILGYDGVTYTQTWPNGWAMQTWYAQEDGEEFPIAERFGFGLEPATGLDLDGDGLEELICNVTYGADGARRACVYQRRDDGVYRGSLAPRDLPGFADWGANAWWEEYDRSAGCFRIHYDVGADDFAQVEYAPAEALAHMEWYPYPN